MSFRQRVLRSAPIIAFTLVIVFLGLSLAGYDPADPPGWNASPRNEPATNPCGPVGSTLAHVLFITLGWSSWLLLLGLAVVDLLVCVRRPVPDRLGPALGFGLLLIVTAGLIHKLAPVLQPSAAVGSGDHVGALVAIFLEAHFGPLGMSLILAAAGLIGLALSHDVVFLWLFQEARGWIKARLRRQPPKGIPLIPSRATPFSCGVEAEWDADGLLHMNATLQPTVIHPPIPIRNANESPSPSSLVQVHPNQRVTSTARELATLSPGQSGSIFQLPPTELLEPAKSFPIQEHEAKVHARAMLLERTLLDFGHQVRVVQIDTGPVITQYEIELEAGLRVSKITSLSEDLAIALAVQSVRIVAPIPGKTTVGIEVPNDHRNVVRLGEVMAGVPGRIQECRIPLFLGKDAKGQPLVFDLAEMPHLLMAGRTGTGKSVCLNAMILSILMTKRPDEVKMILIDPKKVELSQYKRIPHLMHPVVTDMKKAESLLAWACEKMDERYEFLRRAEVRNIAGYNRLSPDEIHARLNPEDDAERAPNPDQDALHRDHRRRTGGGHDDR